MDEPFHLQRTWDVSCHDTVAASYTMTLYLATGLHSLEGGQFPHLVGFVDNVQLQRMSHQYRLVDVLLPGDPLTE